MFTVSILHGRKSGISDCQTLFPFKNNASVTLASSSIYVIIISTSTSIIFAFFTSIILLLASMCASLRPAAPHSSLAHRRRRAHVQDVDVPRTRVPVTGESALCTSVQGVRGRRKASAALLGLGLHAV
jgi:hypothetical protein